MNPLNALHPVSEPEVRIPLRGAELEGTLLVPDGARGMVLFVHGSGSSRHSPRNRRVAQRLQLRGLGTLLFDLFTEEEEERDLETGELRFDIPFLAQRLVGAARWVEDHPGAKGLRLGYFGASTGGAAALEAAAEAGTGVGAVVSRGGRPDLAQQALPQVLAPTLLIVGGRDPQVLALNRWALARLSCERRLDVVPGATHLFEEPGALDAVAELAADWFLRHLENPHVDPHS